MSIGLIRKFISKSKDDLKGHHFNELMIIQTINWYLRYAPLLEKILRSFRKPHCDHVIGLMRLTLK